MKSHIFCQKPAFYERFLTTPEKIRDVLDHIASGTDTRDLTVSVFLYARGVRWGGRCHTHGWLAPKNYFDTRLSRKNMRFPIPGDLPAKYKIIRIYFGGDLPIYPATVISRYRFQFRFPSFEDHLAHLFAHELHHFRRYHLGLHPGEGESSAEKWAHRHIASLGFTSKCSRYPKRAFRPEVLAAYEKLRDVKTGRRLILRNLNPRETRIRNGEAVTAMRPPRKRASRLSVKTSDGRLFHVPFVMLEIE